MPQRSTTSAAEAAAMRAAGARLVRHAHDMVLDLSALRPGADWADPALPSGLSLIPGAVAGQIAVLADAMVAAYPPGHPDAGPWERRRTEVDQNLVALLVDRAVGPVLQDASALVVDRGGAAVAAVLVTDLGPAVWGWPGGAWVAEVLVVPDWQGQGLGRTLLRRAMACRAAAGEAWMGLTVTDGNRAERLYQSLGFERRRTLYILDTGPGR